MIFRHPAKTIYKHECNLLVSQFGWEKKHVNDAGGKFSNSCPFGDALYGLPGK
jgi:hypothetical protein